MGIRLTGFSTPVLGATWEFTNGAETPDSLMVVPGQKIKVFISSICGVPKYDSVRAELRKLLEDTKLADVYTFEGTGGSTLTAEDHYTFALEDCDVCIFLIDNADGITPGVQKEIDTVEKYNIKALYYFCDETRKEKTALQQSLMGARYAKSKTVHSFDELSKDSAQALIDDIITIFHYYCVGKLVPRPKESVDVQRLDVVGVEKHQLPMIPKTTIKNVDRSKNYLMEFVLGYRPARFSNRTEKTSEFDEWGVEFLQVLLGGKSIKHFNTSMFLETLKSQQKEEYFQITQIRWKAIQAYFAGDVEKCFEYITKALDVARKTNQATWVIKDILIDMRNIHWTKCDMHNIYFDTPAQKELVESEEELYYPVLDRIRESLNEKYIEGLYKDKVKSPYTVSFGNSLDQFGEMLASVLIISMYNGSLTHILLFYEELRDFVFYLSGKYEDWNLRLNLFKLAIFNGKHDEIKGIRDSYPEVLGNLSDKEALSIMAFCENHPIHYKRFNSLLLAFGMVGYFLDDESFTLYEKRITDEIMCWLTSDNSVINVGLNIFKGLSGVSHRLSQDMLAEICLTFIERNYSRWFTDMFRFIQNHLDLRKMSEDIAKRLIEQINILLQEEDKREQVKYAPRFLCSLRNQNRDLTNTMEQNVAKYLPEFYENIYQIETFDDESVDILPFIREYVEKIKKSNETQGQGGAYFSSATREIATLKALLQQNISACDVQLMDDIIETAADTLLMSKESVSVKLDAVTLLTYIVFASPEDYARNQSVYENLYIQQEIIETAKHSIISSNVDGISLNIGLKFLYIAMGKDEYDELIQLLPNIYGDIATTISVTHTIAEYLDSDDAVVLPRSVEIVVLQNTLLWLQSENLDVRWNATQIFLMLSRNPENHRIINQQLVNLVDSGSMYIKNMIMWQIQKIDGVSNATKEYIFAKCRNDSNYVVRMVCSEIESGCTGGK